MPDTHHTVADFYTPIFSDYPQEVQELLVRLLREDFKSINELEDAIMAAASSGILKEAQS